jgi:hypothetical protein
LIIWSVVNFVITPNQFGAFFQPQRPYKTSDQYPLKLLGHHDGYNLKNLIFSLDDFYVMDSGLVMLQTTINCLNSTLYDNVSPKSLLAWQRVRVANQLSSTGEEWAVNSMKYNSGTYNNQYMVIDTKLWEAGKPLKGKCYSKFRSFCSKM